MSVEVKRNENVLFKKSAYKLWFMENKQPAIRKMGIEHFASVTEEENLISW